MWLVETNHVLVGRVADRDRDVVDAVAALVVQQMVYVVPYTLLLRLRGGYRTRHCDVIRVAQAADPVRDGVVAVLTLLREVGVDLVVRVARLRQNEQAVAARVEGALESSHGRIEAHLIREGGAASLAGRGRRLWHEADQNDEEHEQESQEPSHSTLQAFVFVRFSNCKAYKYVYISKFDNFCKKTRRTFW